MENMKVDVEEKVEGIMGGNANEKQKVMGKHVEGSGKTVDNVNEKVKEDVVGKTVKKKKKEKMDRSVIEDVSVDSIFERILLEMANAEEKVVDSMGMNVDENVIGQVEVGSKTVKKKGKMDISVSEDMGPVRSDIKRYLVYIAYVYGRREELKSSQKP
ncbi:UNVERIFIED_CONTAM: hypothetical protein FKN15_066232 [Acipenser sinensis]